MPLALTTPIAGPSIDTIGITRFADDVENGVATISYNRLVGSVVVDSGSVSVTHAALNAAAGANRKAKTYNALATALGTPGTVT